MPQPKDDTKTIPRLFKELVGKISIYYHAMGETSEKCAADTTGMLIDRKKTFGLGFVPTKCRDGLERMIQNVDIDLIKRDGEIKDGKGAYFRIALDSLTPERIAALGTLIEHAVGQKTEVPFEKYAAKVAAERAKELEEERRAQRGWIGLLDREIFLHRQDPPSRP